MKQLYVSTHTSGCICGQHHFNLIYDSVDIFMDAMLSYALGKEENGYNIYDNYLFIVVCLCSILHLLYTVHMCECVMHL